MLKERLQRLGLDRRLKEIYKRYERFFIPGFLVVGFAFDVVTFRSLQMSANLKLQLFYVLLAAIAFSYSPIYDALKHPPKWVLFSYLRFLAPFAEQISFGSLLSSSLLFYWFSGSFSVSWPLIAVVTGVMISSEVFRKFYMRPAVQLSVYNFVLLAYFSLLLPFVLHSLNAWVFMLSGFLSTLFVLSFVLCLGLLAPKIRQSRQQIFVSVLMVFFVMNIFYFFKLIPPVPLAIRDAGIYHDVERVGNEYTLVGEDESFPQNLLPGQTLHISSGDTIFAYTAIFAPSDLSTVVYHRWQYKDPATGKWEDKGLLHFVVHGGRAEGYRGYTQKQNLAPGKWRVTVQNRRGQVLGRLKFTLLASE